MCVILNFVARTYVFFSSYRCKSKPFDGLFLQKAL